MFIEKISHPVKKKFPVFLAVISLALTGHVSLAADSNTSQTTIQADASRIVTAVNEKIAQGKQTETDLAEQLKALDALYARHKGEPDASQILGVKIDLYLKVLNDPEKAAETFKQSKKDVPETAETVNSVLEQLKAPIEAQKIRRALAVGTKFPDFVEKDMTGRPVSIASYKGKVVLIDFWATWCGPCMEALPTVLQVYEKYHPQGFEIIGVSLDEDPNMLRRVVKWHDITWPQIFDGKRFEGSLPTKYGVSSTPTTYLLDGNGKIIGKDLRGPELEKAVAAALAKK